MFTFYLVLFFISGSELNAPKDMLHKHVSNTPVITNITLNSSFSIPLLLLSLAYCIQYCYSISLNFSLSLLKSTVERVALHQFTSVRVSMWEFYMLSCQFCPIYQQFNWFFFLLSIVCCRLVHYFDQHFAYGILAFSVQLCVMNGWRHNELMFHF